VPEAQATGVKTRNKWRKTNWDEIAKTPEAFHLRREAWLLNFDAEKDLIRDMAKWCKSCGPDAPECKTLSTCISTASHDGCVTPRMNSVCC
jgi:hypothetical protein